jgi:hypothetical protein
MQTPVDWHELHDNLTRCPWFVRVGRWTDIKEGTLIKTANSWNEAIQWAEADISWWCVNEASNVLSEFLHINHNQQYQEWNNHITSFCSALDALIAGPVTAALPHEAPTQGVVNWIRSHLTRAYLECVYSPLIDIQLVRNQVDWYLAGHFPCGWHVDEEAAFPGRALTVVY